MNDFFGKDNYEVPQKVGGYMKLQEGENRIRILGTFSEGTAIKGWEYWITGKEGGRVPVRKMEDESIITADLEEGEDKVKHFWALPVYNVNADAIQLLELTQVGIQKAITNLAKDRDWGNPTGYDISITRTKTGPETMNVEYTVSPKPAKPLDAGVIKRYKEKNINIQALFAGKDPFNSEEEEEEVEVGFGVNKSVEMTKV